MSKNLFDEYVNLSKKNIHKYLKFIFKKEYDQSVAEEYVECYVNARYYNLSYKENSRFFYLRIRETLSKKMEQLLKENKEEKKRTEDYVNAKRKEKIINNMFLAFDYIVFFDKVRDAETMKRVGSIEEVVDRLYEDRKNVYLINERGSSKEEFVQLVKDSMLECEVFLDRYFADDTFELEIRKYNDKSNLYNVNILSNIRIPMIYSSAAIKMAYNSTAIREERLLPEYILLSLLICRDVVELNFRDQYIVEFTPSLVKKTKKLKQALDALDNPALQDKVIFRITYEDFIKNKQGIFELMKEGYEFAVTIDTSFEEVNEIERLQMFEYIIVPKFLKCSKQIMKTYKKNKKIIYE